VDAKNRNPFCQPDLSKIDQRRRTGTRQGLAIFYQAYPGLSVQDIHALRR
jgi:hypothetical protein